MPPKPRGQTTPLLESRFASVLLLPGLEGVSLLLLLLVAEDPAVGYTTRISTVACRCWSRVTRARTRLSTTGSTLEVDVVAAAPLLPLCSGRVTEIVLVDVLDAFVPVLLLVEIWIGPASDA